MHAHAEKITMIYAVTYLVGYVKKHKNSNLIFELLREQTLVQFFEQGKILTDALYLEI